MFGCTWGKGRREDRFEKRYGRWRGFVDNVVWRYLDCGVEAIVDSIEGLGKSFSFFYDVRANGVSFPIDRRPSPCFHSMPVRSKN
jgi:hypothetical protein